jgi:hypothetical protein
MNHIQIAELLDRYWEGETTLVEERQIKDYFASGVVDDRFRDVAPFFQALNKAQLVNAPEHLGKKISPAPLRVVGFNGWKRYMAAAILTGIIAIGGWMYTNTTPATVVTVATSPVTTQQQEQVPTGKLAVATLPATPKAKLKRPVSKPVVTPVDIAESTISEAEALQAVEEIKAALALVSRKFNKGKNGATKNLNKMELVDHYFKQQG